MAGTVTTNPGGDLIVGWNSGSRARTRSAAVRLVANQANLSACRHRHIQPLGGTNTINANAWGAYSSAPPLGSTGAYNLSGTGGLSELTPPNMSAIQRDRPVHQTGGSNTIHGTDPANRSVPWLQRQSMAPIFPLRRRELVTVHGSNGTSTSVGVQQRRERSFLCRRRSGSTGLTSPGARSGFYSRSWTVAGPVCTGTFNPRATPSRQSAVLGVVVPGTIGDFEHRRQQHCWRRNLSWRPAPGGIGTYTFTAPLTFGEQWIGWAIDGKEVSLKPAARVRSPHLLSWWFLRLSGIGTLTSGGVTNQQRFRCRHFYFKAGRHDVSRSPRSHALNNQGRLHP